MSSTSELLAWTTGTPTGGPNGDGRYPLTYADGLTYLVYCPAAQALNPSLSEQPIEVFANTASAAANSATTSANAATQAKIDAQTAAANAAASATAANTSKTQAAASATAAQAAADSIIDFEAGDYYTGTESDARYAAIAHTHSQSDITGLTAALNAKIESSLIGAANGVTPLASDGKVATAYLPTAVLGQVAYQGTWNASGAAPTTTPQKGWYYVVTTAGSTNLSGITDWKVGDWAIYNGSAWDKVDNTDAIASWNGRTGAVVPQANDYTFAQIASPPTTLAGYGITDAVNTSQLDTAGTANKVALRDAGADIAVRTTRATLVDQTTISGAIAYRINNGTDNYVRYCTSLPAIRTFLDVQPTNNPVFTGRLEIGNGTDGLLSGAHVSAGFAGMWHSALTPSTTNYALLQNAAGTQTYFNATSQLNFRISNVDQMQVLDGVVKRKNANSTTMTNQPRIFVQSADPGAAAADGDIWIQI